MWVKDEMTKAAMESLNKTITEDSNPILFKKKFKKKGTVKAWLYSDNPDGRIVPLQPSYIPGMVNLFRSKN
jgi:hypothetical protein